MKKTKELLYKQLVLLAEQSKKLGIMEDLALATREMVRIAEVLLDDGQTTPH